MCHQKEQCGIALAGPSHFGLADQGFPGGCSGGIGVVACLGVGRGCDGVTAQVVVRNNVKVRDCQGCGNGISTQIARP